MLDLGVFLTADEKNWIGRSYEFVRAFKDWRFNDMLQTTHPGVTTLWLVGGAVTAKMLLSHVPFSFQNLSHFVVAAQLPVAVINALIVPVIYLLLLRLFPKQRGLAALASVMMALDPFLIGYSRVAHVDALLAGFMFLAALATMLYVQKSYARRWLVASALLTGLAVLTKAPAVFMVPFFGLVVLARERREFFRGVTIRERGRDFLLWLLIVGLLFFLLWPAMLFVNNPQGNVLVLKRDLVIAAATPHNMTENYTLNPSHYLYTLLTRTTPVTLVFSVMVVIVSASRVLSTALRPHRASSPAAGGVRARGGGPPSSATRSAVYLLIAYVFFFVLMMTLGAKKGDRYILPVYPAIDVLAAMGAWSLALGASRIISKLKLQISNTTRLGNAVFIMLSFFTVLYFGFTVYGYHPYAIAYSNPLFPDNLSQELGWGEGLEQVGAWLDKEDPKAVVAAWYPEELAAYTTASVAHINAHEQPRVHYVVLYKNMFGRAPDHYANDFIDEYYKKRKPVFVARVAGKEFAWVYTKETFERVVGEIVPGMRMGQQLEIGDNGLLRGIEILTATFSGRADEGELVVKLRESLDGVLIHQWRIPVSQIEDNQWLKLELPQLEPGGTFFVEIGAEGTRVGNAPTVRYSSDYNYWPSRMLFNNNTSGELTGADVRDGDLAIHLRAGKEK